MDKIVHSNAAILLLSKKALKSSWIQREVIYFKTVSDVNPDFKVLTVLIGELSLSKLKKAPPFDALHLEDDQILRISNTNALDTLSKSIFESLGAIKDKWSDLEGEAKLIKNIKKMLMRREKEVLLDVAKRLDLKQCHWYSHGSLESLSHGLAHELATSELGGIAESFCEQIVFFKEDAKLIIQHLTPFQINGQGARKLRVLVQSQHNASGLNAETQKIATYYLNRASGSLSEWAWITINGIVDPEDLGKSTQNQDSKCAERKVCGLHGRAN